MIFGVMVRILVVDASACPDDVSAGAELVGIVPDADITGLDPDDDIGATQSLHVRGAYLRTQIPGRDPRQAR